MQGKRYAKIIIGTKELSENLGKDDGIGKHDWGLHSASMVTLIAVRAVLASFHPGRGGHSLICSDRGRAAEHDTTFMAALVSKKVFIAISVLIVPLNPDNSNPR